MSFFKISPVRATILGLMLLGATAFGPAAAHAGGTDYGGDKGGQHGYKGGHSHEDGQSIKGGDQAADQSNTAEVRQEQRNKNFNVSPAFVWGLRSDGCGCDYSKFDKGKRGSGGDSNAGTKNVQGNWNDADADVEQDNDVDQSQAARQDSNTTSGPSEGARYGGGHSGDQSVRGGDQSATQDNKAGVTQDQSNKNFNLSPAIVLGSGKDGCGCDEKRGHGKHDDDRASTKNVQGNWNDADADVDQDNDADQEQTANQSATTDGSGFAHKGKGGLDQVIKGGDQEVTQGNSATVEQTQENKNFNVSPAISVFGGDASTSNYQTNSNEADADVEQDNDADQSQAANQANTSEGAGRGSNGDQSVKGGDQDATQTNDATVGQDQTNKNVNVSPAISVFGGDASTSNYQTNSNEADADVEQDNDADQSQTARQGTVVGSLLGN